MIRRHLAGSFFFLFASFCLAKSPTNPTFKNSSTLAFIENKGQIIDQNNKPNPSVLYLLNTPGMNVQLRKGGFSYDVYRISNIDQRILKSEFSASRVSRLASRDSIQHPAYSIEYHRIDFDLLNANPNPAIETSESSPGYLNYYTIGTPIKGSTFVRSYKTVTYKNIYPGIDLEFFADQHTIFKYNFIVNLGGNLSSIRLKIEDPIIEISPEGSLILKTSLAELQEAIPHSYFKYKDLQEEIPCGFIQTGIDIYGITCETPVPANSTLIVDPIPTRLWGSYFGGTGEEIDIYESGHCAKDNAGNVYITGTTNSTANIATSGAHQTTYGGGIYDAFLTKFNSSGQVVWATYYGGEGDEDHINCSTDPSGNVFLSGQTGSYTNISTPGSHQPVFGGDLEDGFLAKFNRDGIRLWGTYYGGESVDEVLGCFADYHSNIYVCGESSSTTAISTPGAYQINLQGFTDAFLVKFDSMGTRLWGTYYGGSAMEIGWSCTADTNGYVVLCGGTGSPDNIATPGAHQTALGGYEDGFVALFNADGQRQWGTYYGGTISDVTLYCTITNDGSIYICGETSSSNNIATSGSHQPAIGGNSDAFLVKFNLAGTRQWGTYYGGVSQDRGYGCVVDDSSYVFLYGMTQSIENIATAGSFRSALRGSTDAFLAKFDQAGVRHWGTYYGGQGEDGASGCVTSGDTVFMTGFTLSATDIATPGTHQTELDGPIDVYLVKFLDCNSPDTVGPITGPTVICQGSSGAYWIDPIPGVTGYHWIATPGISIISGQNTTAVVMSFNGGFISGQIMVQGVNACSMGEIRSFDVAGLPAPVPVISGNDTSCDGTQETYLAQTGKTQYQWSVSAGGFVSGGGNAGDDYISITWNLPGLQWIELSYTDTNGCLPVTPAHLDITIFPGVPVGVSITSDKNNICSGESVTFSAHTTYGGDTPHFIWKVNGIHVGPDDSVYTYTPANNDEVKCILTSSNTICTSNNPATSDPIIMIVHPNLIVSLSIAPSLNPVCAGFTVTFTATPTNAGSTPVYQWKVNGINAGTNNSSYSFIPLNGDVVSCVLTSNAICPTGNPATSNQITMTVNPNLPVSVSITASNNPVCSGIAVTYTATPINGGSSPAYQWKVNGSNVGTNSNTYTYTPSSGDQISCILTSNIACPVGNPATSNTITMIVATAPVVTFTRCFDSITTTNAKPFKLKGGIPLGGTYSGVGVNSITGIFNPATAGVGAHPITYTYTNAALCSANAVVTIVTIVPAVTICGQILTDIRDGKTYSTVQIGNQCWLAEDLNYGIEITLDIHQRDNCIPEKYHNPASGIQYPASVYQWDEIMNYEEVVSNQGLCPPGWHIPTEADWNTLFANYINNGFAASPLKYSGFSGFNALLSGARHMNKTWDYQGFATFFWSSTSHGVNKAWAHGMNDADPSVSLYPAFKSNAFSVRCLHD